MWEKPLLDLRDGWIIQIWAAVSALPSSGQNLYRNLSHRKPDPLDPGWLEYLRRYPRVLEAPADFSAEDQITMMEIHRANAFGAANGSVLCLEASRVNHSCLPNVQWHWNPNLGA